MNYRELLIASAGKTGNCGCMGIDPNYGALPEGMSVDGFYLELMEAMDRRGLRPAAFKPNIGYFARLDRPLEGSFEGSRALSRIVKALPEGIPFILDAKRGDIASSSLNYAYEAYECWKADCVTVSPYMGHDSINPFALNFPEKGIYILNRTSNPGGKDLQNRTMEDGEPLYMTVARTIGAWNEEYSSGIGAVVGATNLKEFRDISSLFAPAGIPLLIPGVGSQGGSAEDVIAIMNETGYDRSLSRINSSSALTHPWAKKKEAAPGNWKDVCLAAIEKFLGECSL